MVLPEASHKETINAFTKQQWRPLLELIPLIENTKNFYEQDGSKTLENGAQAFPLWSEAEVITKFLEIVYALPIIVDFNWRLWDEGRNIANDIYFNYETIDIPTKCRIITALVRNDRFCDGTLSEVFKSGLILKILKSIENQIELGINDGTGL
jgi:hypothetical protein